MRVELINTVVRTVVLVGLLAYFTVSLARGLIEDERSLGGGLASGSGSGEDYGIRVLLSNRLPPEPARTWDRIDIAILQAVDIVTPNIPDDPGFRLTLKPGSSLRVQPDTNTGLLLTSKEWGKDYTWPVSAIRIQPAQTEPEPPIGVDGTSPPPSRRDPTRFEASRRDGVFALATGRYRGSLEVLWHSAKDLEAINCLPMEAYLEGVVAVEMSPSFHLEALKAQAIASRSYAFARARLAREARREYDVADTGDDQEYRGAGNGNEAVRTAVYDTRGWIMVLDHDTPFTPLFCASSGGYTESIDNIMPGARDVRGRRPLGQVMRAQPDQFCKIAAESLGYTSSHWTTTATVTARDLHLRLAKLYEPEGRQVGFIANIRAGRRDPKSGRVLSVLIYHRAATDPIEMAANSFRHLVGPNKLRSTLWSPDSPRRDMATDGKVSYEITCTGFGHGVGMSQISAEEMAREQYQARDILRAFYHGVDFVRRW